MEKVKKVECSRVGARSSLPAYRHRWWSSRDVTAPSATCDQLFIRLADSRHANSGAVSGRDRAVLLSTDGGGLVGSLAWCAVGHGIVSRGA